MDTCYCGLVLMESFRKTVTKWDIDSNTTSLPKEYNYRIRTGQSSLNLTKFVVKSISI